MPRRSSIPLALAVLAACNHPPTAAGPAQFEVIQAPPTAGLPNLPLLDTIRVRLVDAESRDPRAGVLVYWSIAEGNGRVTALSERTDARGEAAALWTLGSAGPNGLRVAVAGDSAVTLTTMATAFRVDLMTSSVDAGCGLVSGALWCWGNGFWPQFPGPSDRQALDLNNNGPTLIDSTRQYLDLALTRLSVCGLELGGAVWCADASHPQPALVPGLPPMWALAGASEGTAHCGLAASDSTAWCFVPDSGAPVPVPGSRKFVTIRMERDNGRTFEACGIQPDSTAVCWYRGILSVGVPVSETPVVVAGGLHFFELAKGSQFTCGRRADLAVHCWGSLYRSAGGGLVPVLSLTGVGAMGAMDDWMQATSAAGFSQWFADTWLAPTPSVLQPRPDGLEDLLPLRYGKNTLACVQGLDRQVSCIHRLFQPTNSILDVSRYVPVQPPR